MGRPEIYGILATQEVLNISVGGDEVNTTKSEPGYLWNGSPRPNLFQISFLCDIGKARTLFCEFVVTRTELLK